MNQHSLFGDDIWASLRQLAEALGGLKRVGYELWPDLSPDKAQQRLIDALNPKHRTQLDPERFMQILRMGQQAGVHSTFDFICDDAGYMRTEPVNHEQQMAELQKDFMRAVGVLERIQADMKATGDAIERKGPARVGRVSQQQRDVG